MDGENVAGLAAVDFVACQILGRVAMSVAALLMRVHTRNINFFEGRLLGGFARGSRHVHSACRGRRSILREAYYKLWGTIEAFEVPGLMLSPPLLLLAELSGKIFV